MTPAEFYEQWKGRNLTERESSQTHFRQLCQLLAVPAPYDVRALDIDYKFDAITAAAGSVTGGDHRGHPLERSVFRSLRFGMDRWRSQTI